MTKVKRNKEWWMNQCDKYARQLGEAQDRCIKLASVQYSLEKEVRKHHQNAAALSASMNRCLEVMEETLNELTDAGQGGRVTKLSKYLQIAKYGTEELYQFVNYKDHAEDIGKSDYNLKSLHELMDERLKKIGQKPRYVKPEKE